MHPTNPESEARRESARRADGRFGTQPTAEVAAGLNALTRGEFTCTCGATYLTRGELDAHRRSFCLSREHNEASTSTHDNRYGPNSGAVERLLVGMGKMSPREVREAGEDFVADYGTPRRDEWERAEHAALEALTRDELPHMRMATAGWGGGGWPRGVVLAAITGDRISKDQYEILVRPMRACGADVPSWESLQANWEDVKYGPNTVEVNAALDAIDGMSAVRWADALAEAHRQGYAAYGNKNVTPPWQAATDATDASLRHERYVDLLEMRSRTWEAAQAAEAKFHETYPDYPLGRDAHSFETIINNATIAVSVRDIIDEDTYKVLTRPLTRAGVDVGQ